MQLLNELEGLCKKADLISTSVILSLIKAFEDKDAQEKIEIYEKAIEDLKDAEDGGRYGQGC